MKICALKSVLVGAVSVGVWAGLCGVGVASGQAAAATGTVAAKRAMTFADLMAMKRVSDPQISPSGKWVLFSVTDVSLEKNTKVNHLWMVPLGGGSERQVTSGDGESNGRFSPDGSQILFVSANGGSQQIWLAPWNESDGTLGTAKELTHLSTEADGAIWSPDGKTIAFVSDVYSVCSGEFGDSVMLDDKCNSNLLQRDMNSPTKALVFDHLLYRHWDHYQAPVAQLAPPAVPGQPQGFHIDIARLSHILMLHISDPSNVFDLTPPFDWGNDVIAPTFSLGGPIGYAFSPDSKRLAFVVNDDKEPAASTNNDIYEIDITLHDKPQRMVTMAQGLGWDPHKISTSAGSDDEPEYSPDGKWLAFRSQARAGFESDRFRLMVVQRVSESASQRVSGREWAEPKELMPKFDRWVDEFAWAPDSRKLYIASGDLGSEPIFCVNIDGGKLEQLTITGEYSDLHVSPDGSRLVAGRMTIAEPTKLVSLELGHVAYPGDYPPPSRVTRYLPPPTDAAKRLDSQDQLTHLNDALLSELDLTPALGNSPKFGLDQTEWFWFAGAGGRQVEGFIIRPPGFDAGKKYPVKFVMHGGPQTALGDSWSYRWNWELLAADGYVVVGINRRGSTGYGQKFVDEVSGDWGGRAYEDLMKGLDYAEVHYPFIDKTRECALGASYGGFMANWVLTHTDRFQCIVTHDGMFDPVSAYGSTEEMWFNEWEFRRPEDFPKGWDGFLSDPKQTVEGRAAEPWQYQNLPADQDPFRKWSPMRAIENAKTPTLVIHSQRDYRLDVSQGFELYTALQQRNVPARFLYFPDEGHWVLKPQNSQLWYETVNDWCDRWTKSGKYSEK
jgi:dipeptidyl aminopeptidase/acylaminoacyl peptidase